MTSKPEAAGSKWAPLTDEERERMRLDFSPESVKRRAGLLLVTKSREEAMEFAQASLKAFWEGSPGYDYWTRIHAFLAVYEPPGETPNLQPAQIVNSAVPPDAPRAMEAPTPASFNEPGERDEEEQLPGPDDLSGGAVMAWARALVQRFGDADANAHVEKFRALHPPSSPKAAFWSRVQVQILAPPKPAVKEDAAAPAAPPPTRPWFDPDVQSQHKPDNTAPHDPAQGRLF